MPVSDARYRLERSVDPALTEPGLELATRLVMEICGGTPMEPAISGEDVFPNTTISFPISEVRRLTGLDLPQLRITELLTRLGFEASGSGTTLQVKVPSWRPDVTQKADLAEEVMRMVGVDKVPVDPLPRLSHVAQRMLTPIQNRRRIARRAHHLGTVEEDLRRLRRVHLHLVEALAVDAELPPQREARPRLAPHVLPCLVERPGTPRLQRRDREALARPRRGLGDAGESGRLSARVRRPAPDTDFSRILCLYHRRVGDRAEQLQILRAV